MAKSLWKCAKMINLNGHLLEEGAPEVSLLNRSFKYGDGLFESLRVYEGRILFMADHLNRLIRGMHILRMEFEEETWRARMREELRRSVQANAIHAHGRLRLHVYRGGSGAYLPVAHHPLFLIEAYNLKDDLYQAATPLRLTIYREAMIPDAPWTGCKLASALPWVMASIYARSNLYDDALLLYRGKVSEISSANVFAVQKRKLLTPPLSDACLDGVMRRQVIRIAQQLQLQVEEKSLTINQLLKSDEVFVSNTIRGLQAVRQIEKQMWEPDRYTLTPFLRNALLQYACAEGKEDV
ncbi:MAG: hypothetical protein EAZ89_10010 [Bacteroidetes bacterium]|nr:MAG: hypothetical protein EAZ89_10010 [Bacteroidota bacterium]